MLAAYLHAKTANGDGMQNSWIGWVAFVLLACLITVTSCQAYLGSGSSAATTTAKKAES